MIKPSGVHGEVPSVQMLLYVATARYVTDSGQKYDAIPIAVATKVYLADAEIRAIVDRLTVARELESEKWVIQSARLCPVKEDLPPEPGPLPREPLTRPVGEKTRSVYPDAVFKRR